MDTLEIEILVSTFAVLLAIGGLWWFASGQHRHTRRNIKEGQDALHNHLEKHEGEHLNAFERMRTGLSALRNDILSLFRKH